VASPKQLGIYLAVAFAIAWALQITAVAVQAATGIAIIFQGLVALTMFAPMLAALVASRGLGEGKSGIRWALRLKGRVRWVFIAWLLPVVLTLLGGVLYFAIFPDQFRPTDGYFASLLPSGVELPIPLFILILIQLASAIIIAPAINLFFAVGEESGWRGFMVPALMGMMGRRVGLVVGGIIWGAWHWPLIILIGYEYGIGYPGAPVTGVAAMCLFTVSLGIVLQFLYEKGGTIWIPALAHGAINAVAGAPLFFMPADTANYLFGPTTAGLISVLPTLICAILILLKRSPKRDL
jgi:membrane protease YdiL (CAAX protease family)